MGNIFKYVADEALDCLTEDEECQHCGRSDIDVYAFNGEIIDPDLASDTDLAKEEPEIYYACASCINSGNLKPDWHVEKELKRGVPQKLAGIIESSAFRQKPYVMFMQNPKWPYCCENMAEYIGETPINNECSEFNCWEPMSPAVSNHKLEDFYPLKNLEVMNTMCLFRCNTCGAKYWNFQYSGLFWPGPTNA